VVGSSGPVVADTTPLIVLAGVGMLDLLPHLYDAITIPDAVRDELRAGAEPHPDFELLPWLTVAAVEPDAELRDALDSGEAAAITLAIRLGARAVLLDERRGRRIAQARGLPVVGTLGVLLAAKQAGLVREIRPTIDAMIAQGRRISPDLRDRVLAAAGEDTAAS
jgi:predicted nucleic acid-binding protein